jgi:hypothetical protein
MTPYRPPRRPDLSRTQLSASEARAILRPADMEQHPSDRGHGIAELRTCVACHGPGTDDAPLLVRDARFIHGRCDPETAGSDEQNRIPSRTPHARDIER